MAVLSKVRLSVCVAGLLPLAGLVGCADSQDKSDMQKRQDAALKDPFSYGPGTTAGQPVVRPGQQPAPQPEEDTAKSEWNRFWNP